MQKIILLLLLVLTSAGSYAADDISYDPRTKVDDISASVMQSTQNLVDENIDPFSGSLKLVHTDLAILGNGGFDLSVMRTYQSTFKPSSMSNRWPVGLGWTIHYGRIKYQISRDFCGPAVVDVTAKRNPVLELPDGTTQLFFYENAYSLRSLNNWVMI
jgi:hypothetical protein